MKEGLSQADTGRIRLAHTAALLTIVLWSLTFVQTKVLLAYLSPVEILIDRFALAWGVFWVLRPRFVRTSWREELLFVLLGGSGIFGYYILENLALEATTAVNVGLIVTTAPIFTALVLLMGGGFKKSLLVSTLAGFSLVALGLWIMAYDKLSGFGRGDLLALLGAASFGVYSVLLGRVDRRFDAFVITHKSFFWGVIFLLAYLLLSGEGFHLTHYTKPVVMSNLLILTIVASGLCFVMWQWSVEHIGAASASNYIYLVPLINAIAAVVVLGEELTLRLLVAGVFILGGLIVVQHSES